MNVYNNLLALDVKWDIITNKNQPKKIRYVDETSNQMLLRKDINDNIDQINSTILEKIEYNKYAAVVISDYNKGFLTAKDIQKISKNHSLVFMDTKKTITPWADSVDFIKVNQKEYDANEEYLKCDFEGQLIVTKGREGAILNNSKKFPIEYKYAARDLSGAGDTFLAALVASYIKNNDICEAIKFANKCASWVVTQRGVTIIDINKINK